MPTKTKRYYGEGRGFDPEVSGRSIGTKYRDEVSGPSAPKHRGQKALKKFEFFCFEEYSALFAIHLVRTRVVGEDTNNGMLHILKTIHDSPFTIHYCPNAPLTTPHTFPLSTPYFFAYLVTRTMISPMPAASSSACRMANNGCDR